MLGRRAVLGGSQLYTRGGSRRRVAMSLSFALTNHHPYDHLPSIISPAAFPLISLLPICQTSAGAPLLQGNALILDGSSEHLRP